MPWLKKRKFKAAGALLGVGVVAAAAMAAATASPTTRNMSAGASWLVQCPTHLNIVGQSASAATLSCARGSTTSSTTASTSTTSSPTTLASTTTTSTSTTPATPSANGLHVAGNQLLDGNNNVVHLHGVNRSGTEYACIQGWGIFDGPSDDASVAAIASWHSNIVRVPLNEDCWLGINGVPAAYAGANYINAIKAYVGLLHAHGMYSELSLMWGAPGTAKATDQPGGPDADHSPALWSSLAATFKGDPNVVLAPWGETTTDWQCFMQTGCSNETGYQTASMQQAVTLMRQAGYTGVISVPGIDYANDLSQWLTYRPTDPLNDLVAEAHIYGKNTCDTTTCFNQTIAPVTQKAPVIFGETGETYDGSETGSSYISTFMTWADAHGVGYEAWTWDTWTNGDQLISDYNGTPADAYAAWVQQHYATL